MPSKPNTRLQFNIKSLLSMEENVWLQRGVSAATVLALYVLCFLKGLQVAFVTNCTNVFTLDL